MEKEDQKVVLALKGIENFKHIDENDFVISLRSFQGGIELCHYSGCVSPAYTVLKSKILIDKNYWAYLFKDNIYIQALNTAVVGIREGKNISYNNFGDILVPVPTVKEQNQIAQFLDNETAKIDHLIAKQEQLIELLEEQRKSVVSHAVTKGLDPNAPMKDSGVEWLGEVPKHWDVKKLKHIGESIIGLTYSPNDLCDESENSYLVMRSSNVQNGKVSFEDNVFVNCPVPDKLKIRHNDILICSRNGSRKLIGKNALIKNPSNNLTFGAFMSVFRTRFADYAYWILNSHIFQAQAGSYLTTTVNQLTISNLNNMIIPFAPETEQLEIINFLEKENQIFDNLIQKQKQLINQLKEYRTSVISHAVTGKIDIRELL